MGNVLSQWDMHYLAGIHNKERIVFSSPSTDRFIKFGFMDLIDGQYVVTDKGIAYLREHGLISDETIVPTSPAQAVNAQAPQAAGEAKFQYGAIGSAPLYVPEFDTPTQEIEWLRNKLRTVFNNASEITDEQNARLFSEYERHEQQQAEIERLRATVDALNAELATVKAERDMLKSTVHKILDLFRFNEHRDNIEHYYRIVRFPYVDAILSNARKLVGRES